MMQFVVITLASFVGLYLGFQLDNMLGMSAPGGGIDSSDAVVSAIIAAIVMLAMNIF